MNVLEQIGTNILLSIQVSKLGIPQYWWNPITQQLLHTLRRTSFFQTEISTFNHSTMISFYQKFQRIELWAMFYTKQILVLKKMEKNCRIETWDINLSLNFKNPRWKNNLKVFLLFSSTSLDFLGLQNSHWVFDDQVLLTKRKQNQKPEVKSAGSDHLSSQRTWNIWWCEIRPFLVMTVKTRFPWVELLSRTKNNLNKELIWRF